MANKVKELAKETARATEEISRYIETIPTDTRSAVTAIGQITYISNAIAGAVEEQSTTARELSNNVTEAAEDASEIAQSIIIGAATMS